MIRLGEVWTVRHSGRTIGRITIDGADLAWLKGTFEPQPGFEEFKPLFNRSLELVTDHPDEWEAVYTQIRTEFKLHTLQLSNQPP